MKDKKTQTPNYSFHNLSDWTSPKELDSQGNMVDKKTTRPKFDANGLPLIKKRNKIIK